jgi:hypothetical protein
MEAEAGKEYWMYSPAGYSQGYSNSFTIRFYGAGISLCRFANSRALAQQAQELCRLRLAVRFDELLINVAAMSREGPVHRALELDNEAANYDLACPSHSRSIDI